MKRFLVLALFCAFFAANLSAVEVTTSVLDEPSPFSNVDGDALTMEERQNIEGEGLFGFIGGVIVGAAKASVFWALEQSVSGTISGELNEKRAIRGLVISMSIGAIINGVKWGLFSGPF